MSTCPTEYSWRVGVVILCPEYCTGLGLWGGNFRRRVGVTGGFASSLAMKASSSTVEGIDEAGIMSVAPSPFVSDITGAR